VSYKSIFSSAAESYPLDIQEAEENFDMALITSLGKHVVPYLGDFRVPGTLVAQLGQILQQGSTINQVVDMSSSPSSLSSPSNLPDLADSQTSAHRKPPASTLVTSFVEKVELDIRYSELSSTRTGKLVPRERYSYWCFDLLFLICSRVTQGKGCYVFVSLFTPSCRPGALTKTAGRLKPAFTSQPLQGYITAICSG